MAPHLALGAAGGTLVLPCAPVATSPGEVMRHQVRSHPPDLQTSEMMLEAHYQSSQRTLGRWLQVLLCFSGCFEPGQGLRDTKSLKENVYRLGYTSGCAGLGSR